MGEFDIRKRCATLRVVLDVQSSPDDEFTGAKYMHLSSGCFYWNSRQEEGLPETDWEDVWYGEITY